MKALSGIYAAVVGARNSLYETGFFKSKKLSRPVVSVGNISAGGSGKTPFVIALGKLLAENGYRIDVLSRGYRRDTRGVLAVDVNGSVEEYGDEPLLIARKLGCPVVVGEDRHAAGIHAERDSPNLKGNALHLLDDGFQHRGLHRDFEIVLLNREDLGDQLLPTGRLRESLSATRRADAVVVDSAFPIEQLPAGDFQIWRVDRKVEVPPADTALIAFCGIARPERFFRNLREQGANVREEIAFRDHHRYSISDVRRLVRAQQQVPKSRLVTTEKDSINLGIHLANLNPVVIPMSMSLLDPETAIKFMLSKIAERSVCDLTA